MRYHNITKDDMLNGEGLRVVLWVSGCSHYCKGCHNNITWDCNTGIPFDDSAKQEIFEQLSKDHISGITLSGGDPLYITNIIPIYNLLCEIKNKFPSKNIWLYTGYTFNELLNMENKYINGILDMIDVLVDGKFIEELRDPKYHWAGSTNQNIIYMNKTLKVIKE